MSGTKFNVKPLQYGETYTASNGFITISGDYTVYLGMEVTDDDGSIRTATITLPPDEAQQLAGMLDDSARRARHMKFYAEKAQRRAEKEKK